MHIIIFYLCCAILGLVGGILGAHLEWSYWKTMLVIIPLWGVMTYSFLRLTRR